MKILSSVTGELTLLPTLLPTDTNTMSTRYTATTPAGQYMVIHKTGNQFHSYHIAIIAQRNDTITFIYTRPLHCYLIALENSFQGQVTGIGEILLHERWFRFFSFPAFSVEWKVKKQNRYYLLLITFGAGWLSDEFIKKPYLAIADRNMMLLINRLEQTNKADIPDIYFKSILETACGIITANKGKKRISVKLQDAEKMYKVRHYLDDNINNRLSLATVVSGAKISEYIIKKHFKAVYNLTIHDYINDKRMELAPGLLLSSNNKINDIAHSLGFDTTTFNRLFKQYYKTSPAKYRQAK